MPALNDKSHQPIKIICVGKQGDGKTCSTAPLALLGYKLYILDFDKGTEPLINLLTDSEHFPYANYCKTHSIDLSSSTSVITIDQRMTVGTIDRVQKDPKSGRVLNTEKVTALKPADASGFTKTVEVLMDWRDGERSLGGVYSWGPDVVFVLDTAATMARYGYYYHQKLNGRLGNPEDGYDHQRDVGGAQSWVRKIIEVLFSAAVKCNVIVFSHIDWIDQSRGYAQSLQERARAEQSLNPDGVPEIIGQAIGPKIGKYFNNVFCIRASGSGSSVERKIWTVPVDRIVCKRSGWLKDTYDTRTGMGEIFAQLSGKTLPDDFLSELGIQPIPPPASTLLSASGNPPSARPGSTSRPAPIVVVRSE